MSLYESTFIARPDLTQSDVEKLADRFTGIVKSQGGNVVKKEYWGLRQLAYPVKKNKRGHYMFLGIDAPAAAVKELERVLGLDEDVIRSLCIRVEAISKDPSPILSNDTEDRDIDIPSIEAA